MYTMRRFLRTGSIHGLSRFSSLMNTVYRKYLGDEPYGFYRGTGATVLEQRREAQDSPPGLRGGPLIAIMGTMPGLLEYVGGGFNRFGLPAWLGGASHGNGRPDREPSVAGAGGVSAPKRDLKAEDFQMKGFPGLAK